MKIRSNLHWRMKMWRTQISGLLKYEDYQLPHLLKMKIAFLKPLKTEDLKTPLKDVKKMKTMSCAGSPIINCLLQVKASFGFEGFSSAHHYNFGKDPVRNRHNMRNMDRLITLCDDRMFSCMYCLLQLYLRITLLANYDCCRG